MSKPRFRSSVTVAAVIEHDGRFLLVEEHTPEGVRLNNPAGHLEQGESPLQAVQREVLEETACSFEAQAFLGVYLARFQRAMRGEDITYVRLAFAGRVGAPDRARALDQGIVRTCWLLPEEIRAQQARHRSPLVWQVVQDHLAGRHFPLEAVMTHPSVWKP